VSTLPEGTPFVTLDGQTRKLSAEDLMICNEQEGMCIAGVFGGSESGVSDTTSSVFLESACFNPVYVRKTSRRHLLFTDSAFRFERGSDPSATVYAIQRAALLMKELAGANIASAVRDVYPDKAEKAAIRLNYNYLDTLIGKVIERPMVKKILASLDIEIEKDDPEGLSLRIPTYRVEVLQAADVVEEILRIFGYNNIELSTKVNSSLSFLTKPDKEKIKHLVSEMLSGIGFNEIMNNSLTPAAYYDKPDAKDESLVRIFNPLSSDLNAMRKSLLFGGLESIRHNVNRKNPDLKFYEFGNTYWLKPGSDRSKADSYAEQACLSLFVTGLQQNVNWNTKEIKADFFFLKSFVEQVLKRAGIDPWSPDSEESTSPWLEYGISLKVKGQELVSYGEVKPALCAGFDLDNPVFWADFNWNLVLSLQENRKTSFVPLPKYPDVRRDLSMLVDKQMSYRKIREVSVKAARKNLVSLNLFDVYEGDKIEAGKKSYAVSYILRDEEKTLTDKQIESIMAGIATALEKETGARIRS